MAVRKSIAIIGEGETEWWYFETLRVACRYKFKVAPDFPQHSDIQHMAKLAENYVRRETDHVVCLVICFYFLFLFYIRARGINHGSTVCDCHSTSICEKCRLRTYSIIVFE